MDARYFEDWKVGDLIETLGRTVGDAEISQFVALGGFFEELFRNSEYVAKQSLYSKRFAPGALILFFLLGSLSCAGSNSSVDANHGIQAARHGPTALAATGWSRSPATG